MPDNRNNDRPPACDIDAAIGAGAALAKFQEIEGAPVAVVPEKYHVQVLDPDLIDQHKEQPRRIKSHLHFGDVDSFCRYFKEHRNPHSRIFASVTDTGISLRGVIDCHGKDEPKWEDHQCHFETKATREWIIWQQNNKKQMKQVEFARFLEDNPELFVSPKGADLLELISSLEGHSNIAIKSAVRGKNGAITLSYVEDIELKGGVQTSREGEMDIPATIGVSIAPFEGTTHYNMEARLRYKVEGQKITLWYESVDIISVVRTVAADLMKTVEAHTGTQPYRVAP